MSRNPHQRLPYGQPTQPPSHPQQRQQNHQSHHPQSQPQPHQEHQSPIPHIGASGFPSSTAPAPAQGHTAQQHHSIASIPHQIPMLARHPDPSPQPSASPHQQTTGQEMSMFEVLAPPQAQNAPMYSDSQDLGQTNIAHPAFPGATAQSAQLTDVYQQQPVHNRSQYPPMWPPEHPIQPHQPHSQPPMASQRPQVAVHRHQQLPKYEHQHSTSHVVPTKRKRRIDPSPQPLPSPHTSRETTVTSIPKPHVHGSSTDTRRGKERVQRACTNCGEMNHIRKNKCSRCGTPKEPAKKRPRRQRKKKTPSQPQSANTIQSSGPMLAPHRQGMTAEGNVVPVTRPQSFSQRADHRQGAMQPVFDPRALNFPQAQGQASNTVQTNAPHTLQRGQRQSQEFPLEPPFEENQSNFSHQ